VKILPRASSDFKAVGKHIDYIGRKGDLELETDDGERMGGRIGADLLDDWDLDIDDVRRQASLAATKGGKPPKLVHKLMLSMPPGTPPDKVLTAVRNFAREEFWGRHRYAFVLHTDEPHPHVHLMLKAVSEEGERLNIKKATLRHWRSEFARNLRVLGVEANATERAVRGETRPAKKDGIYRASQRGDSIYLRRQAEAIAADLLRGVDGPEPSKRTLVKTRHLIEGGWRTFANRLSKSGHADLASDIGRFVDQMRPVQTDQERVAFDLRKQSVRPRVRDQQLTR
jgi:hypothetical protein